MNFEFSEEQTMVRESLSRLLRNTYDFETRGKILASDTGWSRDTWQALADMGIMSAAFDETYDGFGGTASDTLIIMEELGKALVVEPFLPTVMLCGKILSQTGGTHAETLISQICEGSLIMALGHAEPRSRFNRAHVATTAKASGDDYILNGHKSVVLAGSIADKLIISARTSGDDTDENGISLFVLDANTEGVTVQAYTNIDGHPAADIVLENVKLSQDALIGSKDNAFETLTSVLDHAILAITAEGAGLCKQMCILTNEYIQTRQQFGVPISKFQVLQHRMVDMFIHQEELVSMAFMCAAKMDSGGYDTTEAASAAKVQLGKSCKFVGEAAVQMHGGMGITEEMNIGHYFMRATMLEIMFGNTDHHIGQYMHRNRPAST